MKIIDFIKSLFHKPLNETPIVAEQAKRNYNRVDESELERRRKIRKERDLIADSVDDILTRLENLSLKNAERKGWGEDYQNAMKELLGGDFLLHIDGIENFVRMDEANLLGDDPFENAKAVWPVDISIIRRDEEVGYSMTRFKSVSPKELRGKIKIVPEMCAVLYSAWLKDDGTWWANQVPLGMINHHWVVLDKEMGLTIKTVSIYETEKSNFSSMHQTAWAMTMLALNERYSWHVAIGANQEGLRILLPTDPGGCLSFFKDREKMEGETRRAALRHWVREHYRETKVTGLAFVCNHLRGKTIFQWRSLACEIFVSAFDLEKSEFFKKQAADWRANRKHNSVKFRLKKLPHGFRK